MIPENPHLRFAVHFQVPTRTAREIEKMVTEPAERVFNGLPGLVGIASQTINERSEIELRFREGEKANVVYLNIQEKMDRIKLMLPASVESHSVNRIVGKRPANIRFKFPQRVAIGEIESALRPFSLGVTRAQPELFSQSGIMVKVDPIRLAKNNMSISEVVTALKSLGISTALGRSNGIMFETGRSFQSIDDVKGALIGARGHRPIRLSDVADVEVKRDQPIDDLSIWVDPDRISLSEISQAVERVRSNVEVEHPYRYEVFQQMIQPGLLILLCFILNFWVVRVIKLPATSLFYLAGLGGLVAVHFLFWKGLIDPPLTVLDLHALTYTLIIGSMFLSVLYIRIRSFFTGSSYLNRVDKTLEQAKLFTLAELIPTFCVLVISMWVASLPILNSAVNLPSREILSGMFYCGFPVLICITIFVMLSTPGEFLKKNVHLPQAKFLKWNLSEARSKWAVWTLIIAVGAYGFVFKDLDIGVSRLLDQNSYSGKALSDFRGYGEKLIFQINPTENSNPNYRYVDRSQQMESRVYQFSSNGMRFLGDLDIGGFSESLKSLQGLDKVGEIHQNSQTLGITLSPDLFTIEQVPNLLFASTTANILPKPLRVLTDVRLESLDSVIIKDNMKKGHRVQREIGNGGGIFLEQLSEKFTATPWTEYLLGQFQRYRNQHWISLIFLFLVFAIYLNSFVRSGLVLFFALSTAGFIAVVQYILPGVIHADSLWLMNVGGFMALFQILTLARVIDIDRTRGFDRDLCLKEVKEKIAPGVYLCSWSFVIALFVAGLTEYIPGLPTLGFWIEAIFNSVLTGLILIFSTHLLFPLFYLNSEEALSEIAFKLYKRNPFRK